MVLWAFQLGLPLFRVKLTKLDSLGAFNRVEGLGTGVKKDC